MDAVAERGVVVELQHGLQASELGWLRELMGWQAEVEDPNEFIEAVKRELFADQVFVFTPEGDLKTFPKGATPIDFAFAVHTDVGNHAAGARVNGQVVPLRYRLRQGDTIEILTDPKVEPRDEWLELVQTSRAKARIKQFVRQRARTLAIETGRSLLAQRLETRSLDLDQLESEGVVASKLEQLGIDPERGVERLYELIGDNDLRIGLVVDALAPGPAPGESMFGRLLRPFRRRADTSPGRSPRAGDAGGAPIEIDEQRVESGFISLSPCCSPLPGDPVVGFRVPGRGIVAHVEGCPVAVDELLDRVFLKWSDVFDRATSSPGSDRATSSPGSELERPVTVRVRTANTVGLLAEMSRAFSATGLNIKQANCRAYEDGKLALNTFHATVGSLARLEQLIDHLREVPGVISVERVFSGPDSHD
jgi:GTP diphosphokinase / guanosine-3',5'-bis(diphosphate) 3'-diphosphatase